jgi:hypothetical protein
MPKCCTSAPLTRCNRSGLACFFTARDGDNHSASADLGYLAYNFIKIHRTLRMTPAMAAGLTTRLWEVAGLVAEWEAWETWTARSGVKIDTIGPE